MGWWDTFSDIVSGADSAIKIGSTVFGLYNDYENQKTYNQTMESSQAATQAQMAGVAENQALVKEIASKNLAAVEGMTDDESYRRTAGIYRALLEGKEPYELEPFRSQFEEIESATQAKLRDIDVGSEAARRQIASTIPQGGMKLRMLADVAMKAQDLKATEIKGARDAIRNKNMELKDTYMKEALTFGKGQPEQLSKGYQTTGAILGQYPASAGASPDAQLYLSQKAAQESGNTVATIGEEIGKLVELGKPKVTQPSGYIPVKPSSEKYANDNGALEFYKNLI